MTATISPKFKLFCFNLFIWKDYKLQTLSSALLSIERRLSLRSEGTQRVRKCLVVPSSAVPANKLLIKLNFELIDRAFRLVVKFWPLIRTNQLPMIDRQHLLGIACNV